MNIQKFSKQVEAVHFDGKTDVQEIAQWSGGMIVELIDNNGRIRDDLYMIDIPCPGGFTTAGADSYIFKDQGVFYAMQKNDFLQGFKEVDANG